MDGHITICRGVDAPASADRVEAGPEKGPAAVIPCVVEKDTCTPVTGDAGVPEAAQVDDEDCCCCEC